jgi:hypothetical protein
MIHADFATGLVLGMAFNVAMFAGVLFVDWMRGR